MGITLKEFSKNIGYSPSTISKVLNNRESCYASREVKEIIKQKAIELDYRPNLTARSLITHKNNTIGVILPSIGGFYTELVRVMEFALEAKGYFGLFAFWRPEDGDDGFKRAYERIVQRGIDGVITCHHTKWLKDCKIPIVVYGNMHEDVDCVFPDKVEYGKRAVDFLLRLGHRKISFMGGTHDLRCKAYRSALEANGIVPEESLIYEIKGSDAGNEIKKLLESGNMPTAILAHNDSVAYSIIHSLLEAGVRVPQDISVVGYDNLPESGYYNPALTTFDLNIEKVAVCLVETVLNRIEKPEAARQKASFNPDIIARGSTAQVQAAKV